MINLENDEEIKIFINQHYKIFLERDADEKGLEYYFNLLKNKKIKPNELSKKFEESLEHKRFKSKLELINKINIDLESILAESKTFEDYLENSEKKDESKNIFVTCYNEETQKGGLFLLKNDLTLQSIFEERMCSGMFFLNKEKIIFTITKDTPQIIAFKENNGEWSKIPISTKEYIFANDSHSLVIWKDKIYVTATGGEPNSEDAINPEQHGPKVGKIIVSDITINHDEIIISKSKVINPFDCNHYHHINDLCIIENSLYMSSHTHCNKEKKIISKGVIVKFDSKMNAEIISNKLEQPHSPYYHRKRLYICSSSQAIILSMNLQNKTTRIEFKGLNAYTRGLLVTDRFLYIGTSFSLGRTNSKFKNPNYGILKFSKDTGETKKIDLPKQYNNVYSIVSDQMYQ